MEKLEINEELLIAYLRHETDERQNEAVERWYGQSPENRKELEQLYYLLFVGDRLGAMQRVDVEKSLTELKRQIARKRRGTLLRKYTPGKLARRIIAGAAVVGLVVLAGVGATNVAERVSQPFVVETQVGERVHVVLPDGTKAWVNSCSRLEYSMSVFSKKRNVNMHGEAYFDVASDKSAPFTVTAFGLNTRVLGTKFNVRANDSDKLVTTTLIEGSVMMSGGQMSSSVKMKPGQQFIYNMLTGQGRLYECRTPDNYTQWISGKLHFNQSTLEEIAMELERYFNVDIEFAYDTVRWERFSGDFETADNIHHILSTLRMTGKFTYVTKGNNITIYSK